ncbi:MAG TPA: DUF488 domain-containing protein [Acetobacteraceae bacterium]|jgi:uncharacterized protein (DUF488 family)|nr:DUF488 domain-containing protein [Acetobacteraceae bacterium]
MPMLYTIGYQGSVQPSVLETLKQAGVAHLLDIRAVPQSRKAGFSKTLLAASLAESGIAYTHLRGLGTPKPGRDAARAGKIGLMHSIFAVHMQTPEAQFALQQARALTAAAPCCLLCFERDHRECHREIVAGLLGGPVVHLVPEPV